MNRLQSTFTASDFLDSTESAETKQQVSDLLRYQKVVLENPIQQQFSFNQKVVPQQLRNFIPQQIISQETSSLVSVNNYQEHFAQTADFKKIDEISGACLLDPSRNVFDPPLLPIQFERKPHIAFCIDFKQSVEQLWAIGALYRFKENTLSKISSNFYIEQQQKTSFSIVVDTDQLQDLFLVVVFEHLIQSNLEYLNQANLQEVQYQIRRNRTDLSLHEQLLFPQLEQTQLMLEQEIRQEQARFAFSYAREPYFVAVTPLNIYDQFDYKLFGEGSRTQLFKQPPCTGMQQIISPQIISPKLKFNLFIPFKDLERNCSFQESLQLKLNQVIGYDYCSGLVYPNISYQYILLNQGYVDEKKQLFIFKTHNFVENHFDVTGQQLTDTEQSKDLMEKQWMLINNAQKDINNKSFQSTDKIKVIIESLSQIPLQQFFVLKSLIDAGYNMNCLEKFSNIDQSSIFGTEKCSQLINLTTQSPYQVFQNIVYISLSQLSLFEQSTRPNDRFVIVCEIKHPTNPKILVNRSSSNLAGSSLLTNAFSSGQTQCYYDFILNVSDFDNSNYMIQLSLVELKKNKDSDRCFMKSFDQTWTWLENESIDGQTIMTLELPLLDDGFGTVGFDVLLTQQFTHQKNGIFKLSNNSLKFQMIPFSQFYFELPVISNLMQTLTKYLNGSIINFGNLTQVSKNIQEYQLSRSVIRNRYYIIQIFIMSIMKMFCSYQQLSSEHKLVIDSLFMAISILSKILDNHLLKQTVNTLLMFQIRDEFFAKLLLQLQKMNIITQFKMGESHSIYGRLFKSLTNDVPDKMSPYFVNIFVLNQSVLFYRQEELNQLTLYKLKQIIQSFNGNLGNLSSSQIFDILNNLLIVEIKINSQSDLDKFLLQLSIFIDLLNSIDKKDLAHISQDSITKVIYSYELCIKKIMSILKTKNQNYFQLEIIPVIFQFISQGFLKLSYVTDNSIILETFKISLIKPLYEQHQIILFQQSFASQLVLAIYYGVDPVVVLGYLTAMKDYHLISCFIKDIITAVDNQPKYEQWNQVRSVLLDILLNELQQMLLDIQNGSDIYQQQLIEQCVLINSLVCENFPSPKIQHVQVILSTLEIILPDLKINVQSMLLANLNYFRFDHNQQFNLTLINDLLVLQWKYYQQTSELKMLSTVNPGQIDYINLYKLLTIGLHQNRKSALKELLGSCSQDDIIRQSMQRNSGSSTGDQQSQYRDQYSENSTSNDQLNYVMLSSTTLLNSYSSTLFNLIEQLFSKFSKFLLSFKFEWKNTQNGANKTDELQQNVQSAPILQCSKVQILQLIKLITFFNFSLLEDLVSFVDVIFSNVTKNDEQSKSQFLQYFDIFSQFILDSLLSYYNKEPKRIGDNLLKLFDKAYFNAVQLQIPIKSISDPFIKHLQHKFELLDKFTDSDLIKIQSILSEIDKSIKYKDLPYKILQPQLVYGMVKTFIKQCQNKCELLGNYKDSGMEVDLLIQIIQNPSQSFFEKVQNLTKLSCFHQKQSNELLVLQCNIFLLIIHFSEFQNYIEQFQLIPKVYNIKIEKVWEPLKLLSPQMESIQTKTTSNIQLEKSSQYLAQLIETVREQTKICIDGAKELKYSQHVQTLQISLFNFNIFIHKNLGYDFVQQASNQLQLSKHQISENPLCRASFYLVYFNLDREFQGNKQQFIYVNYSELKFEEFKLHLENSYQTSQCSKDKVSSYNTEISSHDSSSHKLFTSKEQSVLKDSKSESDSSPIQLQILTQYYLFSNIEFNIDSEMNISHLLTDILPKSYFMIYMVQRFINLSTNVFASKSDQDIALSKNEVEKEFTKNKIQLDSYDLSLLQKQTSIQFYISNHFFPNLRLRSLVQKQVTLIILPFLRVSFLVQGCLDDKIDLNYISSQINQQDFIKKQKQSDVGKFATETANKIINYLKKVKEILPFEPLSLLFAYLKQKCLRDGDIVQKLYAETCFNGTVTQSNQCLNFLTNYQKHQAILSSKLKLLSEQLKQISKLIEQFTNEVNKAVRNKEELEELKQYAKQFSEHCETLD